MTSEQVTAVLEFVAQSLRADAVPPVLVLVDHGTPKGLACALYGWLRHLDHLKRAR